jgi:hypothetical protein
MRTIFENNYWSFLTVIKKNVHDFQRGLRPSIHKEVALKNPKTLHEAIQAALRAEAAETKIETTQRSTSRLNPIEEDAKV